MAEQEPLVTRPSTDERDELAKQRRKLEKLEFDVEQKEKFGKFDVVVPNKDEVSYQGFLDKRPAAGIIRNGDVFQKSDTAKFSSEKAYNEQNGTAEDYYENTAERVSFSIENYESMGTIQLAREVVKARRDENRAREGVIRDALEAYLTADAMKDDTETPEQAQARYEEEVEHFDALVEKLLKRGEASTTHATTVHAEPNGEGHPSARNGATSTEDTSEQPIEEAGDEATEQSEEEVSENVSEADTTNEAAIPVEPIETSNEASDGVASEDEPAENRIPVSNGYYNGKSVRVAHYTPHPTDSTKDGVVLVDEDGNKTTAFASDITYKASEAVTPGEAGEPQEEAETKKWWHGIRNGYYKAAGSIFWAGEWARGKYSKWLEYGVDRETMTEEEQEKRRKENRYVAVIVGAGVAAIGALLIAKGLGAFEPHDAQPQFNGRGPLLDPEATNPDGQLQFPDNIRELIDERNADTGVEVVDIVNGGDIETPVVEATPPSGEVIAATRGMGGIKLFESLDLNSDVWYANARNLLKQFPSDFYLEGGDVRISHTGPLSQAAQDYINALR